MELELWKSTLCRINCSRKLQVIPPTSMFFLPDLYWFRLAIWDSAIICEFSVRINFEPARWDVGVLWQPCLGRITPCFESKSSHVVLSTDLFPSLSSDLVGVGAGRAGEETETEEQAGAGHRHNGPDQLRTIQHLRLLLLFTPPLHLSLPLAPLTKQTKLQPPTIWQTNCKRTEAVYCKMGEGSAEMGGPVYAYMCMCVFVCSPVQCCGLVSVWETGTPDIFTHAYMEKHVNWQHLIIVDVGVCCLLDFDFRIVVVMKRWSGKKQWKPGKELRVWHH